MRPRIQDAQALERQAAATVTGRGAPSRLPRTTSISSPVNLNYGHRRPPAAHSMRPCTSARAACFSKEKNVFSCRDRNAGEARRCRRCHLLKMPSSAQAGIACQSSAAVTVTVRIAGFEPSSGASDGHSTTNTAIISCPWPGPRRWHHDDHWHRVGGGNRRPVSPAWPASARCDPPGLQVVRPTESARLGRTVTPELAK